MCKERNAAAGCKQNNWFAWLIMILTSAVLASTSGLCADWPQFRGPNRDGKSGETGLMREWPEGGPEKLWTFEDLGFGYALPTVTGGLIYTTGLENREGFVYAITLDGKLKWKKPYGRGWKGGRPGTRTTPTVNDGLLYIMSGYGKVVCLDAKTGDEKWAVDTMKKFGARQLRWGITEAPLVHGDMVIVTPGGPNAGIVALDKRTGKTIWVCREVSERSGYCSAIVVKRGKRTLIVTLTSGAFVGVGAETGKLVWRHERRPRFGIQAVSPVYEDGRFYITSGYGGERGEMLELSEDGGSVKRIWSDSKLDCHHGGVIVLNGFVYGASDRNRRGNWLCLNLKTGKVEAEIAAVKKGSIAYADGMIYGYGENGKVGLINPSPTDFRLVSSFKITDGRREHWPHPVISDGRLYIRRGNALMAYDIKAR